MPDRAKIPNRNHKGFTLLELMVAISIFAIVSLLTMGGLNNILNTQEHAEANLQRLTRMQMVLTILSRELQQLSNRTLRDEYGATISAISNETSDGVDGIEFTHQGRFTPGDQLSIQRVAYYLEDKQLIKKTWRVLDRVEDTKPVKQVIMDDIEELNFSFYSTLTSSDGQWQDYWSEMDNEKLRAVKVSIKTSDYNEIYRIFAVRP